MKKIVLFFFLLICKKTFAKQSLRDKEPDEDKLQTKDIENTVEQPEIYFDKNTEESNDEYDIDNEFASRIHLINLNENITEELNRLPISDEQLHNLKEHIQKCGKLISKYELQAIPNFDLKTIKELLNYAYVDEVDYEENFSTKDGLNERTSKISLYIAKKIPDTSRKKKFLGSSTDIILKVRIKESKWDFGFSAKKEHGEEFIWDAASSRFMFNTFRTHLMYKNLGFIEKIIVGSYDVGFGEGLILNAGFSCKKGGETIKILKTNNRGIIPMSSPKQIKYFGIATTAKFGNLGMTIFYSKVFLDHKIAKQDDLPIIEAQISRNCHYKTALDLEKRNQQTEQVVGGSINYSWNREQSTVGLNNIITLFHISYFPKDKDINKFSGDKILAQSLFYKVLWRNIIFFGELGYSKNLSKSTYQKKTINPAYINGITISLSRKLDSTTYFRFFSKAFTPLYGDPFREQSKVCNEIGLYNGWRYKIFSTLAIDIFYDLSKKLEEKENDKLYCHHWLARFTYQPIRESITVLQHQQKFKHSKNSKDAVASGTELFSLEIKTKSKLSWIYVFSKKLKLKSELFFNTFHKNKTLQKGYGITEDITIKVFDVRAIFRLGFIKSDCRETNIYSFEPELLNAVTRLKQYGNYFFLIGVTLVYNLTKNWRIEGKYNVKIPLETDLYDKSSKKSEHLISCQLSYIF